MDDDQQFCLRWNNHQSTLISVFDTLLENGTLVDCTLAAEGKFLKAHKVVLSACSPYFATLLAQQYDKHPIFILKDVKYQELRAMMDYMYRGEVNISQDQLAALLKAAESLQIKGLSDPRATAAGQQQQQTAAAAAAAAAAASQQQSTKLAAPGKGALSIEHKRAQAQAQAQAAAAAKQLAVESDVSMSREGSSSPSGRKRKKVRRRTVEQQQQLQQQSAATAAADTIENSPNSNNTNAQAVVGTAAAANTALSTGTAAPQLITSAGTSAGVVAAAAAAASASSSSAAAAAAVLNVVTKKTEHLSEPKKEHIDQSQRGGDDDDDDDEDDDDDDQQHDMEPRAQRMKHHHHQQQQQQHGDGNVGDELLIEPKSEYDDRDETVEDLTLDDEELMEDLDQAGTSHGGEGSSHGYGWAVDRQDEVFMGGQEGSGQHRDAQAAEDLSITRIAGLTWDQWNARLVALPLITQLREGQHPIMFPTDLSIVSLAAAAHQAAVTAAAAVAASTAVAPKPQLPPTKSINSKADNGCAAAVVPIPTTDAMPIKSSTAVSLPSNTITTTVTTPKKCHPTMSNATSTPLKLAPPAQQQQQQSSTSSSPDFGNSFYVSPAHASDVKPSINSTATTHSTTTALSVNVGSLATTTTTSAESIGNSGGGGGYACPECGRAYKLKSSLRNHLKWECGKDPQFQCPFCVYRAKQKMHIHRHMVRMHKEKNEMLEYQQQLQHQQMHHGYDGGLLTSLGLMAQRADDESNGGGAVVLNLKSESGGGVGGGAGRLE